MNRKKAERHLKRASELMYESSVPRGHAFGPFFEPSTWSDEIKGAKDKFWPKFETKLRDARSDLYHRVVGPIDDRFNHPKRGTQTLEAALPESSAAVLPESSAAVLPKPEKEEVEDSVNCDSDRIPWTVFVDEKYVLKCLPIRPIQTILKDLRNEDVCAFVLMVCEGIDLSWGHDLTNNVCVCDQLRVMATSLQEINEYFRGQISGQRQYQAGHYSRLPTHFEAAKTSLARLGTGDISPQLVCELLKVINYLLSCISSVKAMHLSEGLFTQIEKSIQLFRKFSQDGLLTN